MTTQKQIQKVIEIAQEKGWYVSVDDKKMSNISFEFQRFTKYGQDFNFYAEMQQGNIETLIADIKEYYEDFDPDYEAYLWIGEEGQIGRAHV